MHNSIKLQKEQMRLRIAGRTDRRNDGRSRTSDKRGDRPASAGYNRICAESGSRKDRRSQQVAGRRKRDIAHCPHRRL